jgi:hypothetical protein
MRAFTRSLRTQPVAQLKECPRERKENQRQTDEHNVHASLLHLQPIVSNMKARKEAIKIDRYGIKIA